MFDELTFEELETRYKAACAAYKETVAMRDEIDRRKRIAAAQAAKAKADAELAALTGGAQ